MHPFFEMLSVVGAIGLVVVSGIIVLAVFFQLLSRLSSGGGKPDTLSVRGVLKQGTWAKVHMAGGEVFERVRFVGFTNTENIKTRLPYELNGMVILEDEEGRRMLVRAKGIRMIVIEPTGSV